MIITVTGVPEGEWNRGIALPAAKAVFPRSMRLLRHADFERVYKLGRRHFSTSLTVFYLLRPGVQSTAAKVPVAPGLRIGFTVGRALGGAVQRNRMKRRLREAVRLSRPPAGPSADVVINPKKSLLTANFAEVLNEVHRAFVVMEEKLGTRPANKPVNAPKESSKGRKPRAESRLPKG